MRSIPGESGRIDAQGVRSLWKKAADEGVVVNALIHRENAENLGRMLADFPACELCSTTACIRKSGALRRDPQRCAAPGPLQESAREAHVRADGQQTEYPCADIHDAVVKLRRLLARTVACGAAISV